MCKMLWRSREGNDKYMTENQAYAETSSYFFEMHKVTSQGTSLKVTKGGEAISFIAYQNYIVHIWVIIDNNIAWEEKCQH